MNAEASRLSDETTIRALLDNWLSAVRAGDVAAIMSHYAPDVLAFDAVSLLRFQGAEAYGRHWQECLRLCPGQMIFEIHELQIHAGGPVAFASYLCRCGAVLEDGREQASWMRATVGLAQAQGRWRIVHEHFSAPFDMTTGKALFGLEP